MILYPYSEHSFVVKALKKLYYARTRDNEIFRSDGKKAAAIKRKIESLLGGDQSEAAQAIKNELEMHRMIKLSDTTSWKVFISNICGPFFCCYSCCCITKKQMTKYRYLIKEGEEKLDNDLDIVFLIKSIRNLNIFMKNTLKSKRTKFEIEHSNKNCIDLDGDAEFSESSSDDGDSSSEEGKTMFEGLAPEGEEKSMKDADSLKKSNLADGGMFSHGDPHGRKVVKKRIVVAGGHGASRFKEEPHHSVQRVAHHAEPPVHITKTIV